MFRPILTLHHLGRRARQAEQDQARATGELRKREAEMKATAAAAHAALEAFDEAAAIHQELTTRRDAEVALSFVLFFC